MKDAIPSFSAFNLHNIPEMLMAASSLFRIFLFILALVGVLALGVNSCAAPEETNLMQLLLSPVQMMVPRITELLLLMTHL